MPSLSFKNRKVTLNLNAPVCHGQLELSYLNGVGLENITFVVDWDLFVAPFLIVIDIEVVTFRDHKARS